jgi:hypothetical protein
VVSGISRAVPSNVTISGAKKGAKGGKKRRKRRPRWVAVAVGCNDDDDKIVDDSDKKYVMAVERDFKRQA